METNINPLDGMKSVHKSRIRDGFLNAPKHGFMTSLNIKMDAQREDIDNLTRLHDRLLKTGTTSTTTVIRDYNNQFHTVTIAELAAIVGELVDFGLSLYTRKWECEVALAAATKEEDVVAVTF